MRKINDKLMIIFPERIIILNKFCKLVANNNIKKYMTNNNHFVVCYNSSTVYIYNELLQNVMLFSHMLLKHVYICNSSLLLFDVNNDVAVKKNILTKQYWNFYNVHDVPMTCDKTIFALLGCMLQTHSKICIDNIINDTLSYLTY